MTTTITRNRALETVRGAMETIQRGYSPEAKAMAAPYSRV
jgi:hypothetical protein